MKNALKNQKGFTLIEMVIVLILVGILASFAMAKTFSMADAAGIKAYVAAADELNAREKQLWGIEKMQGTWSDATIWTALKEGGASPPLGAAYVWQGAPEANNANTIQFKDSTNAQLRRTPSTTNSPATWQAETILGVVLQ